MKSFVINIDSKCNASCSHCCFRCNPSSKDALTDNEINNILEYICTHREIKQVSITGGEPLLRYDVVKNIIKTSHLTGKDVTLISNGFWGTSLEKSKKILLELKNLGLNALTISYDDFHAEFIQVDYIRNILYALKEIEIDVAINMVVDKKHSGIKLIEQLGEAIFGIRITMVPASRVGRSHDIPEQELYFYNIIENNLKCPAHSWEFVIHHDGYIYPCCSPSVFETVLRIGSIREETLEELNKSLMSNVLLLILQKEGLKWFIDKLDFDIKNFKYVSVCEICQHIFSSEDNINLLLPHILKYYETNL